MLMNREQTKNLKYSKLHLNLQKLESTRNMQETNGTELIN